MEWRFGEPQMVVSSHCTSASMELTIRKLYLMLAIQVDQYYVISMCEKATNPLPFYPKSNSSSTTNGASETLFWETCGFHTDQHFPYTF